MVNLYIILAGILAVLVESSFMPWPWVLLYTFVFLRKKNSNNWLWWLVFLAFLVDVMSFRLVGVTALMVLGIVIVEKLLVGSMVSFWALEPASILVLVVIWTGMNSQPWWMVILFAAMFGLVGLLVRKRESFVSLR